MKKFFLSLFVALSAVAAQAQPMTMPTHTQYGKYEFAPNTPPASTVEVDLNWETQPATGWGSYAMFWTGFESGSGAYMGLQQDDRDGKKILFSMWDPSSSTKVRPYALPHCKRFDHEGNGGQCIMKYQWKPGVKYKLVMGVIPAKAGDVGFVRYGGWLVDTSTNTETFIGGYEVPDYAGLRGAGSFLPHNTLVNYEYYAAPSNATCASMPASSLTWTDVRVNGTTAPTNAYPRYNTGLGNCANTMNVRTYSKGIGSVTLTTNVPNVAKVEEDKRMWGNATTPVTPVPAPPVVTPPVQPAPITPADLPQQSLDRAQCTIQAVYTHFRGFFGPREPDFIRSSAVVMLTYSYEYAKNHSQVLQVYFDNLGTRNLVVQYTTGQVVDMGPMGDWIALAGC